MTINYTVLSKNMNYLKKVFVFRKSVIKMYSGLFHKFLLITKNKVIFNVMHLGLMALRKLLLAFS